MFGFLPSIGIPELILVLVIALIIFGPGKLPEIGKSIGRSIREFKKASQDIKDDLEKGVKEEGNKEEKANS